MGCGASLVGQACAWNGCPRLEASAAISTAIFVVCSKPLGTLKLAYAIVGAAKVASS